MRFRSWRAAAAALLLLAPGAAWAAGAGPTLAGTFRDWFVYRAGAGAARVCYALAQPRESQPANVQRGEVFFLVSTWPGANKRNEPSIVPGYPYRDGTAVTVEIGGQRFNFDLVRNSGDEGGAWMQEPAQEARLLAAMRGGATMIVTGTSTRGTLTRDTYSLAGISAALDNVAATCR